VGGWVGGRASERANACMKDRSGQTNPHSNRTQHFIAENLAKACMLTTTEPLSQYSSIIQHCCSPDSPPRSVATHQACDSVLMMLWCFRLRVRMASKG